MKLDLSGLKKKIPDSIFDHKHTRGKTSISIKIPKGINKGRDSTLLFNFYFILTIKSLIDLIKFQRQRIYNVLFTYKTHIFLKENILLSNNRTIIFCINYFCSN